MKTEKNFIQKTKEKFLYAKTRTELAVAGAAASMMTSGVYASNAGNEGKNKIIAIADLVVDIFPWIGIFFVIAGALKLFLAYRNDQPEAQTGAAKDIVIGVVLIIFRAFAWPAIQGLL